MLNAYFWRRYFRAEFIPQLTAIVDALENRVLPGFEGLEEESQKVSEDAWRAFMDEDPADFAEEAEQAGVSHYLLLDGLRQGVLNLFYSRALSCVRATVNAVPSKRTVVPSQGE